MSQPEAYPVQPKPAAAHDGHRDDAVVEPAGEGKGMTRSVSQQMLDGLRDATLGPNQRMHQPSVPGRPAKRAEDPEQRPLSFLLSLIAALSVCASVLLVWTTSTEASEEAFWLCGDKHLKHGTGVNQVVVVSNGPPLRCLMMDMAKELAGLSGGLGHGLPAVPGPFPPPSTRGGCLEGQF